ncbi:MAG: cytochrome C oxidase subunit IV family protein [Sulfuricella sp.]|nr:cytochrome C oxidase subunit IV family protein [Sulfuricella sp.]
MTPHKPHFVRPCTIIWLVLMTLTGVTYAIGDAGLGGPHIMLAVLAIAFVKSRMIASYFMGLRKAGLLWRAVMAVYLVFVTAMIVFAYYLGLK